MGCGASKVVLQQSAVNDVVENKDLNGNARAAQQIVANSSVVKDVAKPSEQDKQAEPNQQEAQPVEQQAPEPEKPVSEPVSPEPTKDDGTNAKPAVTYTEESLQEVLELQQKLNSMESKGVVGQYQTQHKLLVSCYADLQTTQKKVEALKQQTLVYLFALVFQPLAFSMLRFFNISVQRSTEMWPLCNTQMSEPCSQTCTNYSRRWQRNNRSTWML